ncbi:hypothetical protein EJB05_37554, partial [Eragrostis curvula]
MAELGGNGGQGGDVAQPGQGGHARGAMCWTPVMSGFVLRRFADLVGEGVKTGKGFKEVHVNSIARLVSEFSGQEVTGTQVYNHLRKWRQRWVRVCKLKDLSGALWDEDNCMITLAEEHLVGHTKDHPKDAEFLNTPIENYVQMQMIFGSGVATGRYAMGSNEPLGKPTDQGVHDVNSDTTEQNHTDAEYPKATDPKSAESSKTQDSSKDVPTNLGKRKRLMSDEDCQMFMGMTSVVKEVAEGFTKPVKDDMYGQLYNAVMFTGGFTEEALMFALSHMLEQKSQGFGFLEMNEAHRVLGFSKCSHKSFKTKAEADAAWDGYQRMVLLMDEDGKMNRHADHHWTRLPINHHPGSIHAIRLLGQGNNQRHT